MDLLFAALGLGFAAGLSPGPLMALVIATSIERGFRAGARVAIAPLASDAPVVLASLFVLGELPEPLVRWLALPGGLFVLWLGLDIVRKARRADLEARGSAAGRDLWRAIWVNLLNPNPWLFWALAGGPLLLQAWRRQPLLAVGFLSLFYLLLVGSKVVLAGLVAGGRRRLTGAGYRSVLGASGLLLMVLGGLMLLDLARRLAAAAG